MCEGGPRGGGVLGWRRRGERGGGRSWRPTWSVREAPGEAAGAEAAGAATGSGLEDGQPCGAHVWLGLLSPPPPPPRTLALSAPGLSPGRSAGREHKSEAHGGPVFLPFFFFFFGGDYELGGGGR